MASHYHYNGKDKGQPEVHWSSTKKSPEINFPDNHEHRRSPIRRKKQSKGPAPCGVKLVALMAILLGIGVMGCCGWVLHRAIQDWRNPTLVTASNLLSQVNTFFGGTTGLYDLDVIYRILTSCSATGFVGGILQFVLSFWLLLAAEGGGRNVAKIWVTSHVFIMCAVGGAFLCIMTNELQISTPIIVFLCTTGVDFLILIPFAWIISMYSADKDPNTFV